MNQYDTKKLTQCLNELAKALQVCNTTQKLTEETVKVIQDYLFYDAVVVHLFNLEQELQLRANYGINIQKENEKIEKQKHDSIIENLSEQKLFIFQDWIKRTEYHKLLPELDGFKSVAIAPLIFKKRILGMVTIGYRKKQNFSHDEIILFENISILVSTSIGNLILQENFQKRVDELKDIIKHIRHDFANDVQSIALALELLSPAELPEGQKKYLRILNKAKDSSINRIMELKRLKTQHEKSVDIDIGIPLKELKG